MIGGAGYIGSHVAKALLEDGASVTVYDDLSSGHKINLFAKAGFVEGSILDYAKLEQTMGQWFIWRPKKRSANRWSTPGSMPKTI